MTMDFLGITIMLKRNYCTQLFSAIPVFHRMYGSIYFQNLIINPAAISKQFPSVYASQTIYNVKQMIYNVEHFMCNSFCPVRGFNVTQVMSSLL